MIDEDVSADEARRKTHHTDVWHMLVKTEVCHNRHSKKSNTIVWWYRITSKLKGQTTASQWTQVVSGASPD